MDKTKLLMKRLKDAVLKTVGPEVFVVLKPIRHGHNFPARTSSAFAVAILSNQNEALREAKRILGDSASSLNLVQPTKKQYRGTGKLVCLFETKEEKHWRRCTLAVGQFTAEEFLTLLCRGHLGLKALGFWPRHI